MIQINELSNVYSVSRYADTIIKATELRSTYRGVVVQVEDAVEGKFEGTLIYFPGVTLKELKAA